MNDGRKISLVRYIIHPQSFMPTSALDVGKVGTVGGQCPPQNAQKCVGIWVRREPTRPPRPGIRGLGPVFLEDTAAQ